VFNVQLSFLEPSPPLAGLTARFRDNESRRARAQRGQETLPLAGRSHLLVVRGAASLVSKLRGDAALFVDFAMRTLRH